MDLKDWNNFLMIVGFLWVNYVGHLWTRMMDHRDQNNFLVIVGSLWVRHIRIRIMDVKDSSNFLMTVGELCGTSKEWNDGQVKDQTLLHIVPFCKGPNKKLEGFAKQKQPAIFAMRHALQLVVHHPSLIYNVPYNHRNTFATYTTNKTLQPAQSPSTLAIFHTSQRLIILKTLHILQYKKYRYKL